MTAPAQTPGYFDALYAANADPWGFETSAYEDAKYTATLAALPLPRYRRVLEVGCSIGVLTERLAPRCDALIATDVAAAALERASARCSAHFHVEFMRSELPDLAPAGPFDLVLLSEVLYYFDREQIARTAKSLLRTCENGSALLLVHWTGPTPDYPLNGDEAVQAFEDCLPQVDAIYRTREESYRLDLFRVARAS